MTSTERRSFTKQPGESYTIAIEYLGNLPGTATLSSGTVAAIDVGSGASASGTVLATTTATISGTQSKIKVTAGTAGHEYKITFTNTLSTGEILEDDVFMRVDEI